MQVLVVAVDRATEKKLEGFFSARQLKVCCCSSAREALEKAGEDFYPFVLLDLRTEAEAGLELCRRIRQEHGAQSYILVLPESETPEAMRPALEAGADDYLSRPLDLSALRLRLAIGQRHLTSRRHTDTAQHRCAQSERRYRTLVETMNEGLFQVNEQGVIEFANSRLSELTGFSLDELIGQGADELLVDPEVRDRLPEQTLLGAGTGSDRYAIPLRTKSDGSVWVNLTAAPLPPLEGTTGGSVGLVEDITEQRAAEEGLRFREEYFRSLMENASDLITIVDLEGQILYQSLSSDSLLGRPAEELLGQDIYQLLHPQDHELLRSALDSALGAGEAAPAVPLRLQHQDGHWCYLESLFTNLVENPVVGGVVITSRDITERRRIEAALKRERAFFQQLFTNSPAGVVVLDHSGKVVDVNRAFSDLFQFEVHEVAGHPLHEFLVPEHLREEADQLSQLVFARQNVVHETVRHRKDGTLVDVSILGYPIELSDAHIGAFALYTDISERKNAERKLFHDAFHDPLTGLPNRTLLHERLERDLRRAKRLDDYRFALLFIDLDGFKSINDSLGHAAGDQLLTGVARRLSGCLRPGDTTARLGGDEFTLILEDIKEPIDAVRIAERVLLALSRPFPLGEQEGKISGSIGIAFGSSGHASAEDLMRDADIAMYRAKARGKNCYEIFDSEMHRSEVERLALEAELKVALENSELELYFQPILSLSTGRMTAIEALLRWNHPERGLLEPQQLLPACEDAGLMTALGRWVFGEACRQLSEWQLAFPDSDCLVLHVNFTLREINQPDFLAELDDIVHRTAVTPSSLALEIQEAMLSELSEPIVETFWQIHRRGFRLLIDDFASGSSSLTALARLPIDALKIGRPFIDHMRPGGEHLEVVRAAYALGESLGIHLVAEEVETADQHQRLRELGFGFAQGYYFSRPMPAAEMSKLIGEDPKW